MKKKQYMQPAVTLFAVKTTLLQGSEIMNVNSTQTVTEDAKVFSRRGNFWDEEDE